MQCVINLGMQSTNSLLLLAMGMVLFLAPSETMALRCPTVLDFKVWIPNKAPAINYEKVERLREEINHAITTKQVQKNKSFDFESTEFKLALFESTFTRGTPGFINPKEIYNKLSNKEKQVIFKTLKKIKLHDKVSPLKYFSKFSSIFHLYFKNDLGFINIARNFINKNWSFYSNQRKVFWNSYIDFMFFLKEAEKTKNSSILERVWHFRYSRWIQYPLLLLYSISFLSSPPYTAVFIPGNEINPNKIFKLPREDFLKLANEDSKVKLFSRIYFPVAALVYFSFKTLAPYTPEQIQRGEDYLKPFQQKVVEQEKTLERFENSYQKDIENLQCTSFQMALEIFKEKGVELVPGTEAYERNYSIYHKDPTRNCNCPKSVH